MPLNETRQSRNTDCAIFVVRTAVGSTEKVTQDMWVYDEVADSIVKRAVTYVPGLYKIFDEIIVNAADNKQRDSNMSKLKVRHTRTQTHAPNVCPTCHKLSTSFIDFLLIVALSIDRNS